jgi:hypothetical protein
MVEKSMPSRCPSCEQALEVVRLRCGGCLGADEQAFVLRFLKASGSLKEVARQYGISYPTVRNRLDGLIERIGRIEAEAAKEGEGR